MYEKEVDLVSHFVDGLIQKKLNQIIITELETSFGRPDIVVIEYDKELLEKRRANLANKYRREISYISTFLYRKGWVRKEKISNYFHFTSKKLSNLLELMNAKKIVDIKEDKVKLKPAKEILIIKRIRVVEAKLSNWKYVIDQAERHLWFSNESYILMPNNSQNILEQAQKICIECGIGMVTLLNGKVKYYNRIKKQKLVNTPLLWELNERIIRGELKNEYFHI